MSHAPPPSSAAPTVPADAERFMPALREVCALAWPTVLTMTSYTIMHFVDRLMVGRVGPLEVAAQGNGGIWAFTPISILLGVVTMINTFVSQNLGAGTPERGARFAWNGLWLSVIFWLVVLIPMAFGIEGLFARMYDPARIDRLDEMLPMQTSYAQILLWGAVITLGARAISQFFYGLHRPMVVTWSTIAGNIVNVLANFVLIFGERGLPELGLPGIPGTPALGVTGAAIGTVIGTSVEFVLPMIVFLGPKLSRELRTRADWRPDFAAMRSLLRLGWPNAAQYGNELICWSIFMTVLVGMFGTNHLAAGWIALAFMHLSFMPAIGFSVAATSLVGRYIGAGRPDLAAQRARIAVGVAVVYMTTCAILFVVFRHALVGLFISADTDPAMAAEVARIGAMLLICAAVFQTFDAFGLVYSGALRGAGDTVFPGMLVMVLSWLLIVGGGWLAIALAPGLESLGPWIAAAIYISVTGVALAVRFESGRWKRIRLIPVPGAAAAVTTTAVEPGAPVPALVGAADAGPPAAPSTLAADPPRE